MGPPKQMWTAEEEAALKAGITKYGTGSWSRILKDPEFWTVLFCRSNVDLKDKWRNIQVTESGSGSRSKSNRPVVNNMQSTPMPAGSSVHFADGGSNKPVPRSNRPVVNKMQPTPMPADSSDRFADGGVKKPVPRLPGHVSGAITDLKEPHGSSRTASAVKIEVNRQYGIAPSSSPFDDAELEKMRGMTPREAAVAAAKAVAEAEAAMTAAEEAVREAEEAEALAEEMQVYAESVRKRLRRKHNSQTF